MDGWVIIAALAVFCTLGLPMLIGLSKVILDHRQKMAAIRSNNEAASGDLDRLSGEYQEFVLGVDSRIQKLEERIRLLEARLRQSGDSNDTQQIRRG